MTNHKLTIFCVLISSFALDSHAGSATWTLNPTNSNWMLTTNWTPATVPNGVTDVASFGVSNVTSVGVGSVTISRIDFTPGASAFTISAGGQGFKIDFRGIGVNNQSGIAQNFLTRDGGAINFQNSATTGSATVFTNTTVLSPGSTNFFATSSAGSAPIFNKNDSAGSVGGSTNFFDDSTADTAVITNDGAGGSTTFNGNSTAAHAAVINHGGIAPLGSKGTTTFHDSATADNATFTNYGIESPGGQAGLVYFTDSAMAGNATFLNKASGGTVSFDGGNAGTATFSSEGAAVSGSVGGSVVLNAGADGANATFINNGATASGGYGATMLVYNAATAGNSTIIANGGTNGGLGAYIDFNVDGSGGNARLQVYGNATVSFDNGSGTLTDNTIGSIEGDGLITLGARHLTIGSNNLDTTFSGTISDHTKGGSLTKVGTGTLTLTSPSTYTGGTTIEGGLLLVTARGMSATGSGAVQINAGTLGGTGTISGETTVGTGSGAGAFLAPGTTGFGTLTVHNRVSFSADANYVCELGTRNKRVDQVAAKGVTINGANFIFVQNGNQALSAGTVFTVIKNTATTPIAGAFANLPDGATVTRGRNTFLASYEGGSGNDLTLTVQ